MKKLPSPTLLARGLTICILLLFMLSAGFLAWRYMQNTNTEWIAEVYQNGLLIQQISLSEVQEPYSFTVSGEQASYNVIRVTPDGIAIESASCPDKICVHQGMIKNDMLAITCLPNHLVIRLVPNKENASKLDAITY